MSQQCPECSTKLRIIEGKTISHGHRLSGKPADKDREIRDQNYEITVKTKVCGACGYRNTEETETPLK